jgi:hypothetical protein
MSTASLLRWIALVAGAEFAVRGYLADRGWICHAGAALVAVAIAALCWRTRARRAGAGAAAALLAVAAVDAAIGAFAAPVPPAPPEERAAQQAIESVRYSADLARGSSVILLFAGSEQGGDSPLPAPLLRAALPRCEPPLEVVEAVTREPLGDPAALESALARFHPGLVLVIAASELLDGVIGEATELGLPATEEIGPRGSRLGRAIEGALAEWRTDRAWRRAPDGSAALDPRTSRVVARYRELVLAARRAGSEVALLITPLAVAPDAAHEHARMLASNALRALAGSYAIPAIDLRPEREGARAVADALAPWLAHAAPGCRRDRS